ncbi:MAG: hypothetical protein AAF587_11050 [Bacteroidota bacterium]
MSPHFCHHTRTGVYAKARGQEKPPSSSRFSLILLGMLFFCWLPNQLKAGAWPQDKGSAYLKLGLRLTTARFFYNEVGRRTAIHPYADFSSIAYGEFGVFKNVTAIASIPFFRYVRVKRETIAIGGGIIREIGQNAGFADPEVGVRFGIARFGAWVISAEGLLGLPLGESMDINNLILGDGEFNQLIRIQAGHSFYPKPFYMSVGIGYNNRTAGFSDELRYDAEFGYASDKWLLNIKIRGTRSLKNGDPLIVGSRGNPNNQSSLIYAPEVNYYLKPGLGLSASIEGSVLEENFISGVTYAVGIFLQI